MPEIGHYVVGLFDVMGQSVELEGVRRIPAPEKEQQVYAQRITGIMKKVTNFRATFAGFFEGQASAAEEFTYPLSEDQKQKLAEWRGQKVQMMQFSDTVICFVPIWKNGGVLTISGLISTLTAAASTILLHHGIRVPIRGAIEIGAATEFQAGEIYGLALASAHGLESKLADWPRVVIGDGVMEFIEYCRKYQGNEVFAAMNRNLGEICTSMIFEDVDGRAALDYLGEAFHKETGQVKDNIRAVDQGLRFAIQEHERFRNARDSKLALRYDQLTRYYLGRCERWKPAHGDAAASKA